MLKQGICAPQSDGTRFVEFDHVGVVQVNHGLKLRIDLGNPATTVALLGRSSLQNPNSTDVTKRRTARKPCRPPQLDYVCTLQEKLRYWKVAMFTRRCNHEATSDSGSFLVCCTVRHDSNPWTLNASEKQRRVGSVCTSACTRPTPAARRANAAKSWPSRLMARHSAVRRHWAL